MVGAEVQVPPEAFRLQFTPQYLVFNSGPTVPFASAVEVEERLRLLDLT